jgi:isopenicillin N synthase-like dioxygenase
MTVSTRVQLRVEACGAHSVLTTLHQPQPAASGSHSLSTLLEGGPGAAAIEAAVRADLEQRSYTLLRADEPSRLRVLRRAEDALVAFFALAEADKEACAGRSELGGACGFNRWPQRQQWHGRSADERRGEPWCASVSVEDTLQEATELLEEVAMRCLGALAAGSGSIAQLHAVCADARAQRADHSVTDGFLYAAPGRQPTGAGAGAGNCGPGDCGSGACVGAGGGAGAGAREGEGGGGGAERMGAHTDPGVLTLKRVSDVAGVELDAAVAGSTRRGEGQRAPLVGGWLPVEAGASADDILVFAADQLQAAASAEGGRLRALSHRVVTREAATRLSLLYELRAPQAAVFSPCRHGRSMDACPVCQYYPVH